MSKYKFCEDCEHRDGVSCPARYDPYDEDACPPDKHNKFMALEKRKRAMITRPRRQKPGW